MPDADLSSLLQYIRDDLAAFRTEFNARIDKLVSQDAFEGERRRVDQQHEALAKDLQEEREARIAGDAEARGAFEAGIKAERMEREKSHAETDQRSRRAWWMVRWTVGTMLAAMTVGAAIWAILVK